MPNPADKSRPGVTITDDPEAASKKGFVVESGVRSDGGMYLRLFFDGHKTVVDEETAWTIVRLITQAIGYAEADTIVYSAIKRKMGEESAAAMLMMMRDERGRRDISYVRQHFYARITDERTNDG